jgi:hypothetical protein
MPTTTDGTGTLGPGTLKIGETGTEIDISCLVNNVAIVPDISEGDSKTMLCGTSKRSADTITWAISGNVDVDAGLAAGFFALTWQHIGEIVAFTYTPSEAVGTTVTGSLKLAPLELGADNYGDYLSSDFEFGLDNFDPATAVAYGDVVIPLAASTGSSSKTKTTDTAKATVDA